MPDPEIRHLAPPSRAEPSPRTLTEVTEHGAAGDAAFADHLRRSELHSRGGTWGGMLFDNPTIGRPTSFSWSFDFHFEEVQRPYGTVDPSLTIDWVTGGPESWRRMVGFQFERAGWEGFEASVYFFEHHRYDEARLAILEQDGRRLRVAAQLAGDIDGLGLEEVRTDDWLDLTDVRVSVSSIRSAADALALLSRYTDTDGLGGEESVPGVYRFVAERP